LDFEFAQLYQGFVWTIKLRKLSEAIESGFHRCMRSMEVDDVRTALGVCIGCGGT